MRKIALTLIGLALSFPLFVSNTFGVGIDQFKDTFYSPNNLPIGKTTGSGVEVRISELVQYAINLILYASGGLAVLMLVIGAIRYITSFATEKGPDEAKQTIKYALIGLVSVILAYALVTNIINLVYKAAS
jgi:hypothetical protein